MTPEDYVKNVLKTENIDIEGIRNRLSDIRIIRLLHASMGLVTEAGEFMDQMKKYLIYGKPLDEANLIEELGDSDWYKSLAVDVLETQFRTIWERNVAKLKARYGDKFDTIGALNRNLKVERSILTAQQYHLTYEQINRLQYELNEQKDIVVRITITDDDIIESKDNVSTIKARVNYVSGCVEWTIPPDGGDYTKPPRRISN